MNSETASTSIQGRRSGANSSAAITADGRMHLQDQRNSRDVVLASASLRALHGLQGGLREHGRPLSPAVPAKPEGAGLDGAAAA
jgi:hypothetical protein